MITPEILEKFREIQTPFYYHDLDVLRSTLNILKKNLTIRDNLVAIRSAWLCGEAMASSYNLRELPSSIFSGDLLKMYF